MKTDRNRKMKTEGETQRRKERRRREDRERDIIHFCLGVQYLHSINGDL